MQVVTFTDCPATVVLTDVITGADKDEVVDAVMAVVVLDPTAVPTEMGTDPLVTGADMFLVVQ